MVNAAYPNRVKKCLAGKMPRARVRAARRDRLNDESMTAGVRQPSFIQGVSG